MIKRLTQSCDDQDSIDVLVLNVFQQNQFYLRYQSNCQQRTPDPVVRGPASSLYLWPQTDSRTIIVLPQILSQILSQTFFFSFTPSAIVEVLEACE